MKAASLVTCGLALIVGTWSTLAGPETKDTKPATESAKKVKAQSLQESGTLTGSYIKRTVRRSGTITDGPAQVVVIDRDAIERSGASDVRQVLTHRGFGR